MRNVEPEVYLVAAPVVDWEHVINYLQAVDGLEWETRMAEGDATESEALIEFGGRLCYRSWKPELNPNVKKVREDSEKYLGNVLDSGHGSVLEHAYFSFVFHNVSRVLTHELVRHRPGAAYSQESMRFVRLTDIPFWLPPWTHGDQELISRCARVIQMLEEHQAWMSEHFGLDDEGVAFSEKKAKTSFMRRFAPDGVATGIMATFNVRALRHIIYMRTALSAEEEIRFVFDKVARICQDEFPMLMQDFERTNDGEWIPRHIKV